MPATALTLVPPPVMPRDAEVGRGRGRVIVSFPGHADVQHLLRSLHALELAPEPLSVELERIRWQLALAVRSHLADDSGAVA